MLPAGLMNYVLLFPIPVLVGEQAYLPLKAVENTLEE